MKATASRRPLIREEVRCWYFSQQQFSPNGYLRSHLCFVNSCEPLALGKIFMLLHHFPFCSEEKWEMNMHLSSSRWEPEDKGIYGAVVTEGASAAAPTWPLVCKYWVWRGVNQPLTHVCCLPGPGPIPSLVAMLLGIRQLHSSPVSTSGCPPALCAPPSRPAGLQGAQQCREVWEHPSWPPPSHHFSQGSLKPKHHHCVLAWSL